MKTIEHIRIFIDPFVDWASAQPDILAVALVGSYARGAATKESDIDLTLLTEQPQKYFQNTDWSERFGTVEKYQTEDYGKLISLRVWYRDGYEVEYGFTTPDWIATPLDSGTQDVIANGMIVLFERTALLSLHTSKG